ncbi:hypothetical protein SLS55_005846 [Diplodia seriata]|uniref:Uncharacterized protein n=1 Tax=Diplodia seriata TaxID=420778 RepID=A0ABR3CIK1_9PEZI
MISSDHLGKPLTIVTPERDEIPLYIQDLLVGLRDIHGKEAIQAGGVHYIPLQLLGPPMIMAPNNPGALKSDVDLENLMAFRKLSTRTQLKLWFLDERQLRTAIHHCGIMLTENPGLDMPVPPTHYTFPAHRDLSWPQFHVGGGMVTTQEQVQKDLCRRGLARADTHTQLAPQPLFIERLLSKMPKDRERNTTLAWPRGRKTAVDFFETVEEYSRIARHLGLEPDNPEMLGMARRHWGQATEKRISDQLASARPTKRRGEIPTELTQPGSGTATDEDVLKSEFSDDVNNGMEID